MIERAPGRAAPFSIRQMGIYLVVDTQAGLVLLWDKKTTLFLRLEPKFKVRPWRRAAEIETSRQKDGGRHREMETERDREGEEWQFCAQDPRQGGSLRLSTLLNPGHLHKRSFPRKPAGVLGTHSGTHPWVLSEACETHLVLPSQDPPISHTIQEGLTTSVSLPVS